MIIVYVKHYLNSAGIKFFAEVWLPKVNAVIQTQPGFITLESSIDKVDASCVHIIVKFTSRECLDTWIKTPEHSSLIELLDPYRTKAWEAARTDDEVINPDTLNWKKIEAA